jgi:hypothetical protein
VYFFATVRTGPRINASSFSDTWFTVFVTCGREKIHTVHIIYMYTHNEWQAWGGGLPFTVASSRPHQTHADSQLPTFLQATCLPLFLPSFPPLAPLPCPRNILFVTTKRLNQNYGIQFQSGTVFTQCTKFKSAYLPST